MGVWFFTVLLDFCQLIFQEKDWLFSECPQRAALWRGVIIPNQFFNVTFNNFLMPNLDSNVRSEIQRLNFIDSWILHLFVDFQMSISDSNMKDKYSLISISVWSLQDQFQNLQNFTTIVSISDYTCKNFGSSQFLVKSFEIWTIPYNLTENFCCWRVGGH